jgi:hypothetical protein
VNEDGELIRRRTERPHQVADTVDVLAAERLLEAPLRPLDARALVASATVQLGQRYGISGDRRVESRVLHVTSARQSSG